MDVDSLEDDELPVTDVVVGAEVVESMMTSLTVLPVLPVLLVLLPMVSGVVELPGADADAVRVDEVIETTVDAVLSVSSLLVAVLSATVDPTPFSAPEVLVLSAKVVSGSVVVVVVVVKEHGSSGGEQSVVPSINGKQN